MTYWLQRQQRARDAITNKTIADIQKQLLKYYRASMKSVISDFEATYDKLLTTIKDGRAPTPADLYKMDRYWQMQSQLAREMQKLGDLEAGLLSKEFENEWQAIYEATAIPSEQAFATVSTDAAKSAINTIWLPDGKNFSQRIWGNTEKLTETLNAKLIECVVTGKKTSELKKELIKRFNVSYNQANTLVRTEAAHIQVQSAAKKYQDYGLIYYEYLGREEKDGCGHTPDCHDLNGKRFKYSEMQPGKNAPPMHPNCRCDIIPVLEY